MNHLQLIDWILLTISTLMLQICYLKSFVALLFRRVKVISWSSGEMWEFILTAVSCRGVIHFKSRHFS